jgi:hypothetical protein
MSGGDDRARRAYRLGSEVLARLVGGPRSNARAVVERQAAPPDLVGTGDRRSRHRERGWPLPMVALARLVALLEKVTNRSITVSITSTKGGSKT